MTRSLWKCALLCSVLMGGVALRTPAQNATSGGDQQPQPDAQMRRGAGGPGGRRGGGIRGTVTSVEGSNVEVKTEEGATWTVISTDNTRVRRDGQTGTVAGVQKGDEVIAMGLPDADKHEVHALVLLDVSAVEVAKAKANLGKTYIVGRITAINDTQLTIMRSDRVSQVISLDESTSLHRGGRINAQTMAAAGLDMGMVGGMGMGGGGRRGGGADAAANDAGEAITLVDVKVGDTVAGTGAVKGGSFVPTDLHVMERRVGGVGGGRPGAVGVADAPPR